MPPTPSKGEETPEHETLSSSVSKAEEVRAVISPGTIDGRSSLVEGTSTVNAEVGNDTEALDLRVDPDFKYDPRGPVIQYDKYGRPNTVAIAMVPDPSLYPTKEQFDQYYKEMLDAPEFLLNEDFIGEPRTGPAHEDPVEGSDLPQPRRIGRCIYERFEIWEHGVTKERYYYDRAKNETKWWFTRADVEAERPGDGKYWAESEEELEAMG